MVVKTACGLEMIWVDPRFGGCGEKQETKAGLSSHTVLRRSLQIRFVPYLIVWGASLILKTFWCHALHIFVNQYAWHVLV